MKIRTPAEIIGRITPLCSARATTAEWKAILLDGADQLRFWNGRAYDVKGKRIGPGIYDLSFVERKFVK